MPRKSFKKGVAYSFTSQADINALSRGVSWYYNWSPIPQAPLASVDFVPMLWNDRFDENDILDKLSRNPSAEYMLILNEPNLVDQANTTPRQAAESWPKYERVAARANVKIVGPQMTWGTMRGFEDPVVWLDAFIEEYRSLNKGKLPRIDYLGFHWYDYGLNEQLGRLAKYGKAFWVTEMANWHSQSKEAQINSEAKQISQMRDMVAVCESRKDVVRYAWFTGRWSPDPHFTSLLSSPGRVTALGQAYVDA